MATPPPKTRANTYTVEEKQQLLDNFDLEGEWGGSCSRCDTPGVIGVYRSNPLV